jgi:hypothetical protein
LVCLEVEDSHESGSRGELPVEIERARVRFARWRKNRKKVTRIRDQLWAAAVDAARLHGVNPTAIALGLDYNHLKERIGRRSARRAKAKSPSFMELIVPTPERSSLRECTIELENARGAKMKIQLQNMEMNDLAAWLQRLWSEP